MRYEGARALIEAGASLAGTQTHADRIARKGQDVKTAKARAARADRKADDLDALVGDDGVPPEPPIGLLVTPFFRSLIVSWIDPADSDLVNSSIVEITPEGGSASTYRGDAYGITIPDLEPAVLHTLRVRLRDRFGRLSDWTGPVSATPERNAADEVDFERVRILGTMGFENLEQVMDATSPGAGIVTAYAMAAQNAALINVWMQNAAIVSAKVANLAVDKLLAGTFTAGQIVLAGSGSLKAGNTIISNSGISMPPTTSFNAPLSDVDYKISVNAGWAALSFFTDSTNIGPTRGIGLRADGISGSPRVGVLSIRATAAGDAGANSTGVLDIYASEGGGAIATNSKLNVYNHMFVGPRIYLAQNGSPSTYAILEFRSDGLYFGGIKIT